VSCPVVSCPDLTPSRPFLRPAPNTAVPDPWLPPWRILPACRTCLPGRWVCSRFLPVNWFVACFPEPHSRPSSSDQPRNAGLIIHPPISTEGKPMKELMAEARRAVGDGLEDWQKPKPDADESSSSSLPPPPPQ